MIHSHNQVLSTRHFAFEEIVDVSGGGGGWKGVMHHASFNLQKLQIGTHVHMY